MAGVGKLLKQAQKMQREMERVQNELGERELELTSGGGAINIVIKASGTFKSLKLDPEFLKEEAGFVSDAILQAVSEASEKAKLVSEEEMAKVSQGMGIPGLM